MSAVSGHESSVLDGRIESLTAIISDIDGTLAHYPKSFSKLGYEEVTEGEFKASKAPSCRSEEVAALLSECYSDEARAERFAGIPATYWRHKDSGCVLKMYELYNLSMSNAVISEDTVLLMELLQSPAKLYRGVSPSNVTGQPGQVTGGGVLCTLITGARTSTFRFRRGGGALPQVCFDCCEGGAKIWGRLTEASRWRWKGIPEAGEGDCNFLPHSSHGPLDAPWLESFAHATGYRGRTDDEKPDRSFPMWRLEDRLVGEGYHTDHRDFDTSFQIYIIESPCVSGDADTKKAGNFPNVFASPAEAERHLQRVFSETYAREFGVTLHINLNRGQVNATGCGKREAMLHILQNCQETMGCGEERVFCPENTVALFDDANDLPFAELCGVGLLPSVAHDEVLAHPGWVNGRNKQWFRPPVDGPLGSEWALDQVVLFKRNQLRASS